MDISPLSDRQIVASWHKNITPWIQAVRDRQIASREAVTNQAILDTIGAYSLRSLLDVGCGEGWLVRAVAAQGLAAIGVDGIPGLIAAAQQAGGGEFRVMDYEAIAAGALALTVDGVVCNFSLFGEAIVEQLFRAIPALLTANGVFIVQTLHPVVACGNLPYRDGWRTGSWAGFSDAFTEPPPWYFRTIASWVNLFHASGFRLLELREPLHPQTGQPASMIFVASRR